jgi:carbonic anhydrase
LTPLPKCGAYHQQHQAGSPILKEMEKNGEIKIIGAIYDMSTGNVTFME